MIATLSAAPAAAVALVIAHGNGPAIDADLDSRRLDLDFGTIGGLQCGPDSPVTVTLAAGGAGVIGKVNVVYSLEQ